MASLESITWESTSKCNLKCVHCARAICTDELSTKEILRVLEESTELGTTFFTIAGGEPLLREDIFEILEYATDLGLHTEVLTNGTLLTPKIVKGLEKALVDGIRVSLDYADKNKYDRWRGSQGAFERVIKGLKILSGSSMRVGINSTIMLDNLSEIDALMNLATKEKVNYIRFAPIVSAGSASLLPVLSADDWTTISSTIIDCARKNIDYIKYSDYREIPSLKKVPDSFALPCPAGIAWVDIMPDGGIRGCPFLPPEKSNVREKSLKDIWHNNFAAIRKVQNSSLEGECKNCNYDECRGGCIAERIIRGGFYNEQKICIKEILSRVLSVRETFGLRKIISGWFDIIYLKKMACLRTLPIWSYSIKH